MADTTGEVAAVFAAAALTGRDGTVYPAARKPSLRDAAPYIAAVEAKQIGEQIRTARALLLGMGFPEAVVDDLDVDQVIEAATGFFSAAFQRPAPANGRP